MLTGIRGVGEDWGFVAVEERGALGKPVALKVLSNCCTTLALWHPAALAWLWLRASGNYHKGSPPGGKVESCRARSRLAGWALTSSAACGELQGCLPV